MSWLSGTWLSFFSETPPSAQSNVNSMRSGDRMYYHGGMPSNATQPEFGGSGDQFDLQTAYLRAFFQAASVYYIAAIFLHYIVPRVYAVRSVQVSSRQKGQVRREAWSSIGPLLVKAGIWTIVEYLYHYKQYSPTSPYSRYNKMYSGSDSSIIGIGMTVFILDVLHDTWFYWTHRLLHNKVLYKWVHRMHHESRVPTAFTGYSFHPIEAMIVFANEILVCFMFPIHIKVHRAYHMYTTVIHSGGHAGYEIAPCIPTIQAFLYFVWNGLCRLTSRGKRELSWVSSRLNTVAHHDMHHRFPNVHFSLYMTHWDKLMGTEHKQYQSYVEGLQNEGDKKTL